MINFIKTTILTTIIILFSVGCAIDGVYAHDPYVYGTIYDNRYRAHYDGTVNGYRHYSRGNVYYYKNGVRIRLDVTVGEHRYPVNEYRHRVRRYDHRFCYYTLREDYDPHRNVRVYRRYRVCR
jgi:hypothetical protein